MSDATSVELYRKYRPSKFSDVIGQKSAVEVLMDMGKRKAVPHAILFTGPSGCGKTTLARILRKKLNCGDSDFTEMDAAHFRGIEMVRDIRSRMSLAPIGGTCRVYLLDEAHQITGAAADALLKMLEDTPPHVYFFLATTDPQKLKATIRTRCTEVKVKALDRADFTKLIATVAEQEGKTIVEEVRDKLIECADGSARKCLVMLHQILGLDDTDAQIESIESTVGQVDAIQLCRTLINPKSTFRDAAVHLAKLQDDPEQIRWAVLGYARSVLLKGGASQARAASIISAFRDNFYDSKHAGLAGACYEVYSG